MSFYGNSFYYAAESFACVVLQNSGLNKYITTLPKKDPFKEVPNNKPVELDALQRNSGLGVQSGNHWIKLASSGNTFQILHNEPAENDPNQQTFQGCAVQDGKIIKDDPKEAVLMNWGAYIEVPVVSYDTTGHIIPVELSIESDINDGEQKKTNITYLKMPNEPTAELKTRMQLIDGKNAEGEDEEPVEGSLKTAFFTRMQQIDGKNAEGQKEEPAGGSLRTELLERMQQIDGDNEDSLKSKITDALDKIDSLWNYVANVDGWKDDTGSQRDSLLQRVQTLENQVDQLIGNKTETIE